MVAGSLERGGKAVKDAGALMMDQRGLAMHRPAGADDLATIGGPDALVPQAHPQDRDGGSEPSYDGGRNARLGRRAGTRRDDDVGGSHRGHIVHAQRVMTMDHRHFAQLSDVAS